jgi:hypothetical protein
MPTGHGLAGMRERIERHGGRLQGQALPRTDPGSRCRRSSPRAPAREIDAERMHA